MSSSPDVVVTSLAVVQNGPVSYQELTQQLHLLKPFRVLRVIPAAHVNLPRITPRCLLMALFHHSSVNNYTFNSPLEELVLPLPTDAARVWPVRNLVID